MVPAPDPPEPLEGLERQPAPVTPIMPTLSMYQPLLTSRYLSTRMIPLLAVVAVGLCVALVIVVVSVMTGFLDMVRTSGRTLMGDVVVSYPIRGIPHYGALLDDIRALPEAQEATPVVDTWGLLRMPYPAGDAKESEQVQIWGIEPASFSDVTGFADTLQWSAVPEESVALLQQDLIKANAVELAASMNTDARISLLQATDHGELDDADANTVLAIAAGRDEEEWAMRLRWLASRPDVVQDIIDAQVWDELLSRDQRLTDAGTITQDGLTLMRNGQAAMVPGRHVSKANVRTSEGTYEILQDGYWWMPRFEGTLTTMPIDSRGGLLEPESVVLPFANEFSSGVYLIDKTRLMVPLDIVQRMTHLDRAELVDEDDPTLVVGTSPARATMVLVRAADGIDPVTLQHAVEGAYRTFSQRHHPFEQPPTLGLDPSLNILTWEQQNASFIGPIEKERELMRTLFSIVYLVSGALIVAIFWAIVYEKTRDIGILRSVGASRMGIVWIFLLYGLAVGVFGSLLGVALGWLVTTNMPSIHDGLTQPPLWLGVLLIAAGVAVLIWCISLWSTGRLLPLLLGALGVIVLGGLGTGELLLRQAGGVVLWDPAVYYFTEVPSDVDWGSAWIAAAGAAICSVIAAAIPAARAADIDPVGALRYE